MGFTSLYIRHCADSDQSAANSGHTGIYNCRNSQKRGLDSSVIDTFPILLYSSVKNLKIGKEVLECAVCLSEFDDGESLRLLPKCSHVFHPECIDIWLAGHVTCPVCRAQLNLDSGGAQENLNPNSELIITESSREIGGSGLRSEDPNQVVIDVGEDLNREMPIKIPVKENWPERSGILGKLPFPRSHSTGDLLVQPGEDTERYTLRLPEEVRKRILASEKLKRTRSYSVVFPREGSSRRGYRSGCGGGEGSSRGKSYMERWVFSMASPFVSTAGGGGR